MYGEYEHTVDAKGRMNFPAKLRDEFGEHFYISKTINSKCLTVYTKQSWEALEEKLRVMPTASGRQIQRFLIGGGCEVVPDKQGRIAIPAPLRTWANITSDVVVVGLVDCAEIWDKSAWEEYNSGITMEDISALAGENGI